MSNPGMCLAESFELREFWIPLLPNPSLFFAMEGFESILFQPWSLFFNERVKNSIDFESRHLSAMRGFPALTFPPPCPCVCRVPCCRRVGECGKVNYWCHLRCLCHSGHPPRRPQ